VDLRRATLREKDHQAGADKDHYRLGLRIQRISPGILITAVIADAYVAHAVRCIPHHRLMQNSAIAPFARRKKVLTSITPTSDCAHCRNLPNCSNLRLSEAAEFRDSL
jgi:hypothetical protein